MVAPPTKIRPEFEGRELPNGRQVSFAWADAVFSPLADQSADLVLGSPPYLKARSYGIEAQRDLRAWVEFMLRATCQGLRVSRGLVIWVVAGMTDAGAYMPGPEALMAEAWAMGINLWRPACWRKVDPVTGGGCGQPGSGGKQWLRSDWEYVIAFKRPGPLPYANPLFQKQTPKYGVGGAIRTRHVDGSRKPRKFKQPGFVNPGNAIYADFSDEETSDIICARVGGGHQGDAENHENEAPYPESLAAFFIQAYSPPGGSVYDPFNGSGTTAIMAGYHGRNGFGTDIRQSQIELSLRRLDRRIREGRATAPALEGACS